MPRSVTTNCSVARTVSGPVLKALTSAWPWPGLHGPAVSRMIVVLVLVAGVVAIYQRIALQEILRPLFRHLGSRHLLPPDQVSSPVGLRLKLAVSFVGVWGVGVGFLWLFQQAASGGSARFAFAVGIALAAGVVLLAVRDVVVDEVAAPIPDDKEE